MRPCSRSNGASEVAASELPAPWLRSPLSTVNEFGGGLPEPLCDAHGEVHVRHASGPQIGQSARRAAKLLRQPRPRETARLTLLVERRVELVQVPPEPAIGSRFRQLDVAHVDDRTAQEFLWCPAEPTQHEQRV